MSRPSTVTADITPWQRVGYFNVHRGDVRLGTRGKGVEGIPIILNSVIWGLFALAMVRKGFFSRRVRLHTKGKGVRLDTKDKNIEH